MLRPVVENGAIAAVEIEIEEQKMICGLLPVSWTAG
jgi:hypothetical protein